MWKVKWRLQPRRYLTHHCTKMSRRDNLCSLTKKISKSSKFYYLELGLYPSITDIVEATDTLIQEKHNHSENGVTVKVSRRTQNLRYTLQMKDLVLHFSVRIWDTFSEVMLIMILK